jgi:hypothetical protein
MIPSTVVNNDPIEPSSVSNPISGITIFDVSDLNMSLFKSSSLSTFKVNL